MNPRIKPKERIVLKVMHENRRPLTINKVAKLTDLSWNTVEKYLDEFSKRGWLIKYKKGQRTYYSAYKFG